MSASSATPVGREWRSHISAADITDLSSSTARPSHHAAGGSWLAAFEQLEECRALSSNWDGYGAAALDDRVSQLAGQLMAGLQRRGFPEPRVVPVSDGGLQLEWVRGSTELEVEIDPEGAIVFLYDDPRFPDGIDGQLPGDEGRFSAVVQRVFAGLWPR